MDIVTISGDFPPEKIEALVQHIKNAIAGREADTYGIAAKYWSAVAHSLFTSIFAAFIKKSRHEADELGNTWKDHTPKYKAYNRPDAREGLRLYDNRAVLTPDLPVRPTLPPEVNRRWGGRWLALYFFLEGKGQGDAKKIAGGSTWEYFKAQGYPTLIDLTKHKKLPILHRTGVLQRSLFPSPLQGGLYVPIDSNQIFKIGSGFMEIGTRFPFANQLSIERPIWPKNISLWTSRANGAGRDAIFKLLPEVLRNMP